MPSGTRTSLIHPIDTTKLDEALLIELRQRQQTAEGRVKLRERVAVEHTLAHVGHWQGRRTRYRGVRKNLFDLRRRAVVCKPSPYTKRFDEFPKCLTVSVPGRDS